MLYFRPLFGPLVRAILGVVKRSSKLHRCVHQNPLFDCDLQGRKIDFTNSKTLVSRPTVTRVTFDLPECKEPVKKIKK